MSGMGGMAGKEPQINPKPQTNAMSGMDGLSGKKPQIKPQTVKDAKLDPIDK